MQSSPRSQSPCPSPSPYGLSPSPRLRVLKSDSSRTGVHYGLEYYITGCRQRSINEVYRVHQNCTLIYKALLCIVTEREVRQSGEQKDKRIILLWTNHCHARLWPEWVRITYSVDDSCCTNRREKVYCNAVQPWHEQTDVEHPTTVVFAMMKSVNDLPVAVKCDYDHARCSSMQPECHQGCTIKENAHSHWTRTWVAVVIKHSRCVHSLSYGKHYTSNQLKGRMSSWPHTGQEWQWEKIHSWRMLVEYRCKLQKCRSAMQGQENGGNKIWNKSITM